MFTQEELRNIRALINRVEIKATEARPVVSLQEKLEQLITEEEPTNEEENAQAPGKEKTKA